MRPIINGMLIALDGGGDVEFQYNPNRIEGPTAEAEWAELKCAGGIQPFLQFGCGSTPKISFDLVLSGQDEGPGFVKDKVKALIQLTEPKAGSGTVHTPPKVRLVLGDFLNETCVVKQVTPRYEKVFTKALQPLYAVVSITLWRWRENQ